jgi:hypothetical protein
LGSGGDDSRISGDEYEEDIPSPAASSSVESVEGTEESAHSHYPSRPPLHQSPALLSSLTPHSPSLLLLRYYNILCDNGVGERSDIESGDEEVVTVTDRALLHASLLELLSAVILYEHCPEKQVRWHESPTPSPSFVTLCFGCW